MTRATATLAAVVVITLAALAGLVYRYTEPSGSSQQTAETAQVIPLWPEGVPGAKPDGGEERLVEGRVENVHHPTLTYFPPAEGTANGTAVIVCLAEAICAWPSTKKALASSGP